MLHSTFPVAAGVHVACANAQAVYGYLTGNNQPKMPIGGPSWNSAQLELFNRWMATGCNP
jgi:hypothetical protein